MLRGFERDHDMKRLERAIGIFRRTRKTCKDGTTVYMVMNTDDVAEILGWLEEYREMKKAGLDDFVYDPDRPHPL